MGVLDSVIQMKNQGRNDTEIIQYLQSQGVPPKQIQDALSQAQIKTAVSGNNQMDNMQESIMDNPPIPQEEQNNNSYPQTYEPQQPTNYYQQPMGQYSQDQYNQQYQDYPVQQNQYAQDYYSQDAYPSTGYDTYSGGSDSNTLIEISEQVFSEKIKKIQETIEALNEFKALTDTKVKTMEERLKRIETTIDQLQISILDKIGSYGSNLSSIKKEMAMMQDSFGKLINPLVDRIKK